MTTLIASDSTAAEAAAYLCAHDKVLAPIITEAGPCAIRPHHNYYQELVESIIGQQLSVKAAHSIRQRFCALFGGTEVPEPAAIIAKSIDELRTAGLSRGKATYVQDLAQHVLDGKVRFDHLDALTNEQVITELTAVKGVGEWTAHMFLMFCMGRLDVLAHGDLGIKNGIHKLYKLDHQPTADEIVALAKKHHWHPYETIACWYVWHSLDNMPATG